MDRILFASWHPILLQWFLSKIPQTPIYQLFQANHQLRLSRSREFGLTVAPAGYDDWPGTKKAMGEALTVLPGSVNRGPEGPPHRVPDLTFGGSVRRVRVRHRRALAIKSTPDSFAVVSAFPVNNEPQASTETCLVHVPFNFLVGEMILEAGAYWLRRSEQAGMRTLSAADGTAPRIQIQAIQVPRENSTPNRLLFYCRWDRYFLAQVLSDAA